MAMTKTLCAAYNKLPAVGMWVSFLGLRLLIAWEFWEAGVNKLRGENWFASIAGQFPFPFDVLPVSVSWFLVMWTEIIGAIALLVGLTTRFWVFALIILDLVAWATVHTGNGYNVCDNGYKLPLIYLLMMIPLLCHGPGKLSLDHLIQQLRKA